MGPPEEFPLVDPQNQMKRLPYGLCDDFRRPLAVRQSRAATTANPVAPKPSAKSSWMSAKYPVVNAPNVSRITAARASDLMYISHKPLQSRQFR